MTFHYSSNTPPSRLAIPYTVSTCNYCVFAYVICNANRTHIHDGGSSGN